MKHIYNRHKPGYFGLDEENDEQKPKEWPDTLHPHPKTTRLSLFHESIPTSITDATPLARTIYQARCEVAADTVACPLAAAISTDASTLAVVGAGACSNGNNNLTIYFLDEQTGSNGNDKQGQSISDSGGFRYMALDPGLSDGDEVAVDTMHKLALIADKTRIKSFAWGSDVAFSGWTPARGANVHTMNSGKYSGPVAALPGGRIARAGSGGVAIWDLSTLETHQGGRRVGPGSVKYTFEDSCRDDGGSGTERSTGSPPSTTIAFAEAGYSPSVWQLHTPTGYMLCSGGDGCYMLDLEGGGKITISFEGRYGGNVNAFSTSAGDANMFVTACADGYARLYDIRHPKPVATVGSGGYGEEREICRGAALVHPDGIPTVFTGGGQSQSVKMWDIRAHALVYELATGNTAVHTLTWDDRRSTLYAGTECEYMDYRGNTYGYRGAHLPRWARDPPEPEHMPPEEGDEDDEMDDDDYDSAEESDDEHFWPKKAAHNEKAFGYAYDAGEHVFRK
ncbi:hypothetical protein TRAPUB_8449 [Trametes pubescens]|uniref:Uncharacterized protein n=1 Tax=Trametes pubescens TaxID=154538 RepID=A0A1M2W5B6_TRAPU|nr:hypothetical protein TRAPUB_8449 [Trametes pubescens]